uniref:TSC22 domain family member 1 n=1 Tax=Neogobius melanostomus TaxID=47308 RepID=A0A8C6U226_9GOBI
MHHPEPADSGSGRKMAHPTVFHRRGSNTGTGNTALSPPANSVVNNSNVAVDEFQPALLIQCQPPAGSSSPGPHHPPPQSLNLLSQTQPSQGAGAQIKKKSGFQITSVTPAQISVSTNNSIAEDTESYDDLDESHTEDLSSSEILDTSLSRANDVVGAERSSSEETLNNFHEAETPGAISPNQPAHLHLAPSHSGAIVNGSIHLHHHHHHHQQHKQPQAYAVSSTGNPTTAGASSNVTLKMPSKVGAGQESVSQAAHPGVGAQAGGVLAPGSVAGMHCSAVGTTVSIANPQSSSVSNVNMLSSANVPVRGGISTSASSSTSGFPLNVMSSSGANFTHVNANILQQQSNQNSNITMTPSSTAAAPSASAGMGGVLARVGSAVPPVSAPNTVPPQSASAHPTTAPHTVTTSSRFRVVKLDSSSEPFKKGRWTCTEFYDKEMPASGPSSSASDSSSVSVRQYVTESFTGHSERETTSGSSVSSCVSTLSHYTDSMCSGESSQHAQDYSVPPQAFQAPGAINHIYSQDVSLSQVKTTVAQTNVHPAASMGTLSQQLTYAQAVAGQPTGPAPGLSQPQQVNYPPPQQSAPVPGQVRSEYTQSVPNVGGSANTQMMGAPQPPQTLHHPQPLKPTALQPTSVPPHVGTMGAHLDAPQQKPQSLQTQIQTSSMAPTGHQVSGPSIPPHNHLSDPQNIAPPSGTGGRVTQNVSIAQAHAAQASALYASLPSFTTTQLQDAQRLLLQHQSALLGLPKGPAADTGATAALGQEAEGNAASALTTSTKTVDGEDDG